MFVENSRTTEVAGEVVRGNFIYSVNYSLNAGVLIRLNCSVSKKLVTEVETPEGKQDIESVVHVGSLSIEGGNRNIYLCGDESVAPHVEVFETVLAEVKALLAPVQGVKKATKE